MCPRRVRPRRRTRGSYRGFSVTVLAQLSRENKGLATDPRVGPLQCMAMRRTRDRLVLRLSWLQVSSRRRMESLCAGGATAEPERGGSYQVCVSTLFHWAPCHRPCCRRNLRVQCRRSPSFIFCTPPCFDSSTSYSVEWVLSSLAPDRRALPPWGSTMLGLVSRVHAPQMR